jgi:agmatinase
MKLFPHPISSPSNKAGIFCLPSSLSDASLIIIPAPWEVTVSTRSGTALGPESILKASYQPGLFAPAYLTARKMGIAMLPIPHDWKMLSDNLRHDTTGYIHALELGSRHSTLKKSIIQKINMHTRLFKEDIKGKALSYLKKGKMVAVLGGDHSTALGLIEALSEMYEDFGILQIDAHATLKKDYQGFTYSHASIMHNALKFPQVTKLVQVGLRDYSQEEAEIITGSQGRIVSFLSEKLKERSFKGLTWDSSCQEIIQALPEKIYISFDIDGLDVKLCPGTGAPVPGGLEFEEVYYLLKCLVDAGKTIIGFGLFEVAPGENIGWDAQVGSRMLYRLALTMGASQGKVFRQEVELSS